MEEQKDPSPPMEPPRQIHALRNVTKDPIPWPGGPRPEDRKRAQARVRAQAGQHCWVTDPNGSGTPQAGLLLDWRRERDGWWGRVVLCFSNVEGLTVTDTWLPAKQLHQTPP
ncbi:hypothetical protein [Kineosporia babensis]|uniref:Uncharacterized protein n=1 Tax=Kineosporia babensis TaxID=499548 RepID=A0A9X1NDQ4_9ACTN|nr:hypothetical protein [Kineosporia babensis]MCD5313277.1 hypothetical protein [Kineosporia babensis]